MIRLSPVYYTRHWETMLRLFEVFDFPIEERHHNGHWTTFDAPSALLCLHDYPNAPDNPLVPGQAEVAFTSDENPEDILHRLEKAGFDDIHIVEETYGKSLRVGGPDGSRFQVNFFHNP
jgi:hypothetical protein